MPVAKAPLFRHPLIGPFLRLMGALPVHRRHPALMPLRTGAARMLLEAEATAGGNRGVALVPVGLVFHEPGTFRAGRALFLIGRRPVIS